MDDVGLRIYNKKQSRMSACYTHTIECSSDRDWPTRSKLEKIRRKTQIVCKPEGQKKCHRRMIAIKTQTNSSKKSKHILRRDTWSTKQRRQSRARNIVKTDTHHLNPLCHTPPSYYQKTININGRGRIPSIFFFSCSVCCSNNSLQPGLCVSCRTYLFCLLQVLNRPRTIEALLSY